MRGQKENALTVRWSSLSESDQYKPPPGTRSDTMQEDPHHVGWLLLLSDFTGHDHQSNAFLWTPAFSRVGRTTKATPSYGLQHMGLETRLEVHPQT